VVLPAKRSELSVGIIDLGNVESELAFSYSLGIAVLLGFIVIFDSFFEPTLCFCGFYICKLAKTQGLREQLDSYRRTLAFCTWP
jgi:hypothetical protein